jgi:ribosomal protein L11 methyltransferase
MAWAEVSLSVDREAAELAEQALEDRGALAITFQDQANDPVLEPALGTAPLWPVVKVRGLFTPEVDRNSVMKGLLACGVVERPDAINWRVVDDQDWERAWMDDFRPMRFGSKLWIVPSGMQGPDDPQAALLKLDPGLAFGTGTHPTTSLCLQWIDGQDFQGKRVLDFGCGSGVLGIATAIKGAQSVCCVDNDPQAIEATMENARRNEVSDRVQCQLPENWQEARYDVVLANILAAPLIELAPQLCRCLDAGAYIVLSGILSHQSASVAAAYFEYCGELQAQQLEDWIRLEGHKSNHAVTGS